MISVSYIMLNILNIPNVKVRSAHAPKGGEKKCC